MADILNSPSSGNNNQREQYIEEYNKYKKSFEKLGEVNDVDVADFIKICKKLELTRLSDILTLNPFKSVEDEYYEKALDKAVEIMKKAEAPKTIEAIVSFILKKTDAEKENEKISLNSLEYLFNTLNEDKDVSNKGIREKNIELLETELKGQGVKLSKDENENKMKITYNNENVTVQLTKQEAQTDEKKPGLVQTNNSPSIKELFEQRKFAEIIKEYKEESKKSKTSGKPEKFTAEDYFLYNKNILNYC